MKKISLVLVMVLVCSIICTPINSAFARTNENSGMTIYEYAEQLAEEHPNWEIRVVNDTLHIVNHDNDGINSIMAVNSTVEGGTYREFIPPIFYPSTSMLPYRMYYLPEDVAGILHLAKNNQSLFEQILIEIAGKSYEMVQEVMLKSGSLEVTLIAAAFVATVTSPAVFIWIDRTSFNNAYEVNHMMKITQYTLDGWPGVMYESWNGLSTPQTPFELFSAHFYRNEYDLLKQ